MLLAILLCCALPAAAADLHGSWAASAGNRNFAGTWTAQPQSNGAVTGTWTLQDPTGRILLQGAWSASKAEKSWDGAWRAAVSGSGAERTGTWAAAVSLPLDAAIAAMLESASKTAVSGTWKSGPYAGSWSIRASP